MGTLDRNEEVESTVRQFLEVWMTAWNKGDDAKHGPSCIFRS